MAAAAEVADVVAVAGSWLGGQWEGSGGPGVGRCVGGYCGSGSGRAVLLSAYHRYCMRTDSSQGCATANLPPLLPAQGLGPNPHRTAWDAIVAEAIYAEWTYRSYLILLIYNMDSSFFI